MRVTGSERGVGIGSVPRPMCSEWVGGGLAVVVHGRGRGLFWGAREVQGCHCVRSFGRRGREKGWSSRWAASGSARARVRGER
jgi:hypothetical protein